MIDTPDQPSSTTTRHLHRPRRTALVSSAALAIAVTVGGAAHAVAAASGTEASTVQGGLVEIVSTEGYAGATAAGTGMILSSDGEILTNNHVIEGATSIEVTVAATGATYKATVVGTAPTKDVAVLQLQGASGLKTVPLGNSDAVKVGQSVVASGNAGGTGQLSTVTGTVTDLDQNITASDNGADAENLTGLIETNAPIVAGDSGGALATTSGKVIGMNTAASVSNGNTMAASYTTASEAYAIPIRTALKIANQIESGKASSTIHIGLRGFLGVQLASTGGSGYGDDGFGADNGFGGYGSSTGGVLVAGVVPSGAAESAGLQAGDTITAVNGTTVDSVDTLNTIMAGTKAGQQVRLSWTTASGQTQTATVTLGTAAAD
jgi:S1-C subfamily serine protease